MATSRYESVEAVCDESEDALVVGFRIPSGSDLIFQVGLTEPDKWDAAAEIDTYCIVVDSGPSAYGGVEDWSLGDDVFAFTLNAATAERLGMGTQHVLRLKDPVSEVLRQSIGRVLGRSHEVED